MKSIAFLGNINNNYYNLIKSLEDLEGFIFTLYLNTKDPIVNLPASTKTSKNFRIKKIRNRRNLLLKLLPGLSPLRYTLNKYDLIFTSAEFITLAPYCSKPIVFFPTGADLTQSPFPEMYENFQDFQMLKKKIVQIYAKRVIKGVNSADLITAYPFKPITNALNKISPRLETKMSKTYLPLALDPYFLNIPEKYENLNSQIHNHFSRILIGSRIIDEPLTNRVDKGSWKNISEFVSGLKLFLNENTLFNDKSKIQVQIIYRKNSPDFNKIVRLFDSFELSHLLTVLYPKDDLGFSRSEFRQIMSDSNLIVDDFGIGWYGSLLFETLSLGKCYIGFIDKEIIAKNLKEIPIHNCFGSEEIAVALKHHFTDCQITFIDKQAWITENFSKSSIQKKFLELISELGF